MAPKLLFLIGIVLTHGVVGAVLIREEVPAPVRVSSCVYGPETPMQFEPQAEMLAMNVATFAPGNVGQP